jgi:hypothetical protein
VTTLQTTGYKLNRILANKNGEFHMGYGYFYGPEVEGRNLVWFQGLRRSLTLEDRVIAYYRTPDGHELTAHFTGSTTGFGWALDQEAAEAEWKAAK